MIERPKSLTLQRIIKPSAQDKEQKFYTAVSEIEAVARLPHGAALALLCGLCATGLVRSYDDRGKWIDPAIAPMGDAARPLLVSAIDFREWMRDNLRVSLDRDAEIARRLRAGDVPGKTISWKEFYDAIRSTCGGWLGKGAKRKPARGFGDRHIRRIVQQVDI